MLVLTIPGQEYWDEEANEFKYPESVTLELEHSLVSLSKWESIHEKPFLTEEPKTSEEVLSYVQCMIVDPKTSPEVIDRLSEEQFAQISAYFDSKQTATTFRQQLGSQNANPRARETITSELIYFWMISFQIPWEAERWHLNRLFTLIRVCHVKSSKPEKGQQLSAADRARINAERQAKYGTTG